MTKGLNKNKLSVFALVLAAAFLTGCQNDTEPAPDITSGIEDGTKSEISEAIETTDISIGEATDSGEDVFIPKLLMETDKPFVLAEKNYIIEKREVDVSIFNEYGYTEFVDDGKYYYSSDPPLRYGGSNSSLPTQAGNEAIIFAYDSKSGECRTLYSEAPKAEGNRISIEIWGIGSSYLFFNRSENGLSEDQKIQNISNDLLMLNLHDNTAEKIFSYKDEEAAAIYLPVISGDTMFFNVVYLVNIYPNIKPTILQYDMITGETSLFRDNAQNPIPYNNGIIYFHDEGFYYHGEASDIKGQGDFYEGDELIFYSDSDFTSLEDFTVNIETDTLIYTHTDTDGGNFYIAGSTMGIFDRDFNRIEIASTEKNTWMIRPGGISKTGLVAIDAPKPMIYDTNEECFAVISIDDYKYYRSFVTDDSACFFAYENSNDKFLSAALYTVKRR